MDATPSPSRRCTAWRVALATVALALAGTGWQPAAAGEDQAGQRLQILQARLDGSDGWRVWFGGRPTRELVVAIRNTGPGALADVPVTVRRGRGDHPRHVVASPRLGGLEAGGIRVYRVRVDLERFSFGTYVVEGDVGAGEMAVQFRLRTASHPWGLLVAGAVVLQLGLLRLRDVLRRRVHRVEPRVTEAPPIAEPAADWRRAVLGISVFAVVGLLLRRSGRRPAARGGIAGLLASPFGRRRR